MNAEDLLRQYETSHFDAFVPADKVASLADQAHARKAYEANPVTALLENVDQAKRDIRATQDRLREAERDGLFDVEGFKAAGKNQRKRWITAIETVRGDHRRAMSELQHWREYVSWAMDEQTAKLGRLESRLPPEKEEEAVPF